MAFTLKTSNTQCVTLADILNKADPDLNVGDEISFELKDGTPVTFVVAHKNLYGAAAALVLKDCLPDRHYMNNSWTNRGGWQGSDMHNYLMTTVYELIPDELKEIIKERTILQEHNGNKYESTDKLWLLSRTELEGNYSTDVCDVHFDLFNDERSRVKQVNGETWWYWTRSPLQGNTNNFCGVGAYGSSNANYASDNLGVAFGFLI